MVLLIIGDDMKKGFTLVELIVVITLLTLVSVVVGVSFNKVSKQTKENDEFSFVEKVVSATNLYVENSLTIKNDLESNKGYVIIKLDDLIKDGLISANMIDPDTNKVISENSEKSKEIMITMDSNNTIKVKWNVKKEDKKEYYLNVPDIVIDLSIANAVTDWCNYQLNNVKYVETSGIINKNINANSIIKGCTNNIPKVLKLGDYKIIYEYEANNGFKKATRNVVITDLTAPHGTVEKPKASNQWTNGEYTVKVKCEDRESGCKQEDYEKKYKDYQATDTITIEDKYGNKTGVNVNVYLENEKAEFNLNVASYDGSASKKKIKSKYNYK